MMNFLAVIDYTSTNVEQWSSMNCDDPTGRKYSSEFKFRYFASGQFAKF